MDNVLISSLFNTSVSVYIDLLKLLARLEKVIFSEEERITNIVKQRAYEMVDLAATSIEIGNLLEHDGI